MHRNKRADYRTYNKTNALLCGHTSLKQLPHTLLPFEYIFPPFGGITNFAGMSSIQAVAIDLSWVFQMSSGYFRCLLSVGDCN